MSKVVNIHTTQNVLPIHDEWAEIGVHLETRLAAGKSLDDAANELVEAGVSTERVGQYLRRDELHHPEWMARIAELYTVEENETIQRWLMNVPLDPQGDVRDAARVAEIVLFPIRTTLPQWAAVYSDGRVILGREHQLRAIKKRDDLLEPYFLCAINWADSGPGMSWPESYHLVLLPGYEIYVVTASQDSEDMFGHTDLALSFVSPRPDRQLPLKSALDAIAHWWRSELDAWNQGPWEDLWAPGQYNPYKLMALRKKIWANWEI